MPHPDHRRYYATVRASRAVTRYLNAESPTDQHQALQWIRAWRWAANIRVLRGG